MLGLSLNGLPATALLAGAALVGGISAPLAQPRGTLDDESALAIPRVAGPLSGGASFNQPLRPSEAAGIRRVFELQRRGAIAAANEAMAGIDAGSPLGSAMAGTILADRYLGRFTRPGPDELRSWLARWSDLPAAPAIHALLVAREPVKDRLPPPPSSRSLPAVDTPAPPVPEEVGSVADQLRRNPDLDRSVAEAARSRGASGVERLLSHTRGLGAAYESQLRGEAARILFTRDRDTEALAVATKGARCANDDADGCKIAALARYVGGLAAWRLGRGEQARPMFEAAWRAEVTTPSLRAAAAFWAARASLLRGREGGRESGQRVEWLARAATERYTFYGTIARRVLRNGTGRAARFRDAPDDEREILSDTDVDAVAATPAGLRAFAMLQVGERDRAEAELRLLWPSVADQPPLARAVMLVAENAGFSGLAAQLADQLQAIDRRPREATRFHVPRLRPEGGFLIDPAMVYALARTESNFDANLVSSAGARGILQLMPETASFVRGGFAPDGGRARKRRGGSLDDAAVNLALGQSYVAYLAELDGIDGDLIRLLASYNAGPNAFARWSADMHCAGDPFLFVEAIPVDETRAFVPRVLTYTWIYATRLGLPSPSLDELAAGEWPRYHPLRDRADGVVRPH